MITNPEYLPKDRLKQELRKHGISFNQNENKDYYVQLYRDEVMQGKEPEKGRSEFSSDEEFVKQSPRPSKKQTKNTPAKSKRGAAPKIDTYLPQVETLSDKELSEQLQGYGENVGPITGTTRSVYERKLAKLMATEGVNPAPVVVSSTEQVDYESKNESFIGEWSDDDEEEEEDGETEEAGSAPPPQRRVVSQSSRTRKQYTETLHVSSAGGKGSSIRQRPPSSSTPLKPSKPTRGSALKSSKPPSTSGGPSCSNIWSLVCSVLLIVLMFSIAFLVYEHYTCPEEQESLIISGWKKAGVLVVEMREWILKELPAEGTRKAPEADPKPAGTKPKAKPKKNKPNKAQ